MARVLGVSATAARRLIADGAARRASGERLRKGDLLSPGDAIEVAPTREGGSVVAEAGLSLDVLYESVACVVVDKPAGLVCHPLRAGEGGTVANGLVARFPECATAGAAREAGLCHRLDRETSGTLLAARTPGAYRALRVQFEARSVEKVYLALVTGQIAASEGRLDAPLSGKRTTTKLFTKRFGQGRGDKPLLAVTTFATLWSSARFSLLSVRIETGVRYQIRAHLAGLGHPLAGDPLYGGGPFPPSLPHHLLHAARLGFEDPATGERVLVRAPLPPLARAALQTLGVPAVVFQGEV